MNRINTALLTCAALRARPYPKEEREAESVAMLRTVACSDQDYGAPQSNKK